MFQRNVAFDGILNNIGGFGKFDEHDGVTTGTVLASPSRHNPNYFFQWTRDSALTIKTLVDFLEDHKFDLSKYRIDLSTVVEAYIYNAYNLQRVPNPAGDFESLEGLGEAKFMPDGKPFEAVWGRPQRDGPGLRVITISKYLNLLKEHDKVLLHPGLHNETFVYEEILKPDLEYIIKNWKQPGFDLWEEVNSIHLFTSLTQLKALKMGLEISKRNNDNEFHHVLTKSFNALRFFILAESGYKSHSVPYLLESPELVLRGERSGLDIASILASLQAHDITSESDSLDIPFPVEDSVVFNTLIAMINDMKTFTTAMAHPKAIHGSSLLQLPLSSFTN
ncbi:unnamed protein product [Ambrosiozyma monospora]|uniref:Unnamed protein product n=1 Tax=Ambrosiozyma monospora TaxID=43982 RepID=A0ACB5U219_AMBMO|nr:unnamed protein product [Ambrosiozyma monospora]